MNSQNRKRYPLLPFSLISAASMGDADAINAVLSHYSGYIATLSMLRLYDEYGQIHSYVDEGLRRRLETKLITKILCFRTA